MASCPRCKRPMKGNHIEVQGVQLGPKCAIVVHRRQRIRESFGTSGRHLQKCSVTGREFYAGDGTDKFCPTTLCVVCKYNTPPFLGVERCPLEVEFALLEIT